MSTEAKGFAVIIAIVILMACFTSPFPIKNHLVQMSDGTYAVQRCRGFLFPHCRIYNVSDTQHEAYKQWQDWEKFDHPEPPPTVTKVIQ